MRDVELFELSDEPVILPRPREDVEIPGWYEPDSGNSDPVNEQQVVIEDNITAAVVQTTKTTVNSLEVFIKKNFILLTVIQWALLIIILFKMSKK